MSDKERVQDFQRKLYRKAKRDNKFRFYILYDKILLNHFLRVAFTRCKSNGGCPGIDGLDFADIERTGVDKFLSDILIELKNETYKPQAVLRVRIPKPNGQTRLLGIPTIRDRVIQMATKLVIEPIFEADFEPSSYGFRPKRSASQAVTKIKENLQQGKCHIFDADLRAYFDTIPHKELMHLLALRISDKRILHLIKMWLKSPIVENGRSQGGKKSKVGIPQGGVISPLLGNIYLHLLDRAVNKVSGIFQKYGVSIIRYADDFVLMAKSIPKECLDFIVWMFGRMKLSLNEEKSRLLDARNNGFDFLGFTYRYDKDLYGRYSKYWNIEPSKKSQKKIRANISQFLHSSGHFPPQLVVKNLNSIICGWMNYFSIKGVSYPKKAYRSLRWYLMGKLTRYYRRKSQRRCKLYNRGAFGTLVEKYHLINPATYSPAKLRVNA